MDSVDADELPRWMTKLSERQDTVEVTDQEKITVPKWAGQERPDSKFLPADEMMEGLPDWARRGSDEKTVEVGEEEEDVADNEGEDEEGNLDKNIREFKAFQMGGNALKRPHLKPVGDVNVCQETSDFKAQPHVQSVVGRHVTDESPPVVTQEKASIKMVDGVSALQESHEITQKPLIKASDEFHITQETESAEDKIYIKRQEGISVNQQSTEERQVIPRRHRNEAAGHITEESKSEVKLMKKPSLFGHVSQLSSSDYIVNFPRLRRLTAHQASEESQFKDFGIKPRIRMNHQMSATKESDKIKDSLHHRPQIRILANQYANLESVHVDENEVRVQRFRNRNLQGHSSDSTVQRLLYGSPSRKASEKKVLGKKLDLF